MRMLSTRKSALLALVLAAVAAVCWFTHRAYDELYNLPIEARLISNFNVEQVRSASPVTLNMSGQPMYSGMVVRNVTIKTRGSVMFVTPHLALVGLAKPIAQGAFEYQVVIPDSVDEVRFGKPAIPVWKRNKR